MAPTFSFAGAQMVASEFAGHKMSFVAAMLRARLH